MMVNTLPHARLTCNAISRSSEQLSPRDGYGFPNAPKPPLLASYGLGYVLLLDGCDSLIEFVGDTMFRAFAVRKAIRSAVEAHEKLDLTDLPACPDLACVVSRKW